MARPIRPTAPANRRELRGPRRSLIGVLAVVAAFAIVWVALPQSAILAATQVIAAVLLLVHHPQARATALIAALIAGGWSVVQIVQIDVVTWRELVLLGAGAFEALLVAGCTPRDTTKRRRSMRR